MSEDEEARFKAGVIGCSPRLRAFAHTLTGHAAAGDDLAQEALARAWRARATFAPDTNLEAWLFRILRNLHISNLRKAKRGGVEEDLELSSWRLSAVDDPSAAVSLNDLRQAMNGLPLEQREALVLVGAGGWSYEEAAAYADCPLGTMKSRVFRARRALVAAVEEGRVLRDAGRACDAMGRVLGLVSDAERSRSGAALQGA